MLQSPAGPVTLNSAETISVGNIDPDQSIPDCQFVQQLTKCSSSLIILIMATGLAPDNFDSCRVEEPLSSIPRDYC